MCGWKAGEQGGLAVEIRQLEYFVAVAEMGGFTRAAQVCHVVQTTVSHSVAALERELGVRLFTRAGRAVELTAEGRAFLDDARDIVERTRRAERSLSAFRETRREAVRIGYYGAGLAQDFPEVVRRFRREAGLDVSLRGADADAACSDLAAQVRAGFLDAYIIAHAPIPEHEAWAEQQVVAYNGVYLGMACDDALAVSEAIPRAELAMLAPDICMFRASRSHEYAAAMREWLARGFGVDSSLVSWNDSLEDVRLLVRCGQCRTVSFFNSDKAAFAEGGLAFRRIDDMALLPVTMAWRKDETNPAVATFAQVARQVSSERGLDVDAVGAGSRNC